jgi:hypothetical protein
VRVWIKILQVQINLWCIVVLFFKGVIGGRGLEVNQTDNLHNIGVGAIPQLKQVMGWLENNLPLRIEEIVQGATLWNIKQCTNVAIELGFAPP